MKIRGWSAVILVLTGLGLISLTQAAIKIDARKRSLESLEGTETRDEPKIITDVLGMTTDEDVVVRRAEKLPGDKIKVRYQETFKGVKVINSVITATLDEKNRNSTTNVSGIFIQNIHEDLIDVKPKITATQALKIAQHHNRHKGEDFMIRSQKSNLGIYQNADGKAKLVYQTSYFAQKTDDKNVPPTRPHTIVDALTGEIVDQWESLNTAVTCFGGNTKVSKQSRIIDVTQSGTQCTMENTQISVINMGGQTSTQNQAYSFPCSACPNDAVNGAYSPLADAMYAGQKAHEMYSTYIGESPLQGKIQLLVHYGSQVQNAFWNGESAALGDGGSALYPLVSVDIVTHEVTHGYTELNSDLRYSRESGTINEAFSDMAGEAAKYYATGSNDFTVAWSIPKQQIPLRYMHNPPLDGKSIKHAQDYSNDLDIHYTSGIYNFAFYTLATTTGWNVEKAFKVFAQANKMYWFAETGLNEGACGVESAAEDLLYNVDDVRNAFSVVGLDGCMSYNSVIQLQPDQSVSGSLSAGSEYKFKIIFPLDMAKARFSLSGGGSAKVHIKAKSFYLPGQYLNDFSENDQTVDGYQFEHSFHPSNLFIIMTAVNTISNFQLVCSFVPPVSLTSESPVSGLSGSKDTKFFFVLTIPDNDTPNTVTFVTTGGTGDADLYYRWNAIPQRSWKDQSSMKNGNDEVIEVVNPKSGKHYVMVHAYKAINNVQLTGSYTLKGSPLLSNGVPKENISGANYEQLHYTIVVPVGYSNLVVQTDPMTGSTGDADLYVALNQMASLNSPWFSWNFGNQEQITIASPQAGTYYVMIDGYQAFSALKLTASYQTSK